MTSFHKAVNTWEKKCKKADVPEETVLAFLVELTQQQRYNLYMHYEEEMPVALEKKFNEGMQRIVQQEPMAHVLGYSWFYGYRFLVSEDVLIPRYETEELCANVLHRIDKLFPSGQVQCADIGTGSGAIAITVCKEEPRVKMVATDISKKALAVAKTNAANNQAEVRFLSGNMVEPLIQNTIMLDVLICNPPYIPQEETMEKSVVDYEPNVALFGGEDGLKFYRIVFENCQKVMKENSFMAFEMGWNQREAMSRLVQSYLPKASYEILKDINGKDRMLFVYFGNTKKITTTE